MIVESWVDLCAAILRGTPKLPGALCRLHAELFDGDDDEAAIEAAELCGRCQPPIPATQESKPVTNEAEFSFRASLYCASEVIRRRQGAGVPIPQWLRRHHARLEGEFQASQSRRETDCAVEEAAQLTHVDWMGTTDVARYLDLSTRQVQRLRAAGKLVGVTVNGGYVFSRAKVIELREERSADG